MSTTDENLYASERRNSKRCLAYVTLNIHTADTALQGKDDRSCRSRSESESESESRSRSESKSRSSSSSSSSRSLKSSATDLDVPEKLKDLHIVKHSKLLKETLQVKREKQRFQISFWCRSGTKCFKPTTEKPFKNCVEVAIFGFAELALQVVEARRNIVKTDINYMVDLSPCNDCIVRLPIQKLTLRTGFPKVEFSFNEQYIMEYKEYKLKGKEAWTKRLEELRNKSKDEVARAA